jgi:hypothetical protein
MNILAQKRRMPNYKLCNCLKVSSILITFHLPVEIISLKRSEQVLMKGSIFWDITLWLKDDRHFGGKFCLRFQGQRISLARNQNETGSKHNAPPAEMLIYTWNRRARQHNRSVQEVTCSSGMSAAVTSRKVEELFVPTDVRISNLMHC